MYQYDKLAVWMTADANLTWAQDSGCSCPTPFEYLSVDELERGSLDALRRAASAHVARGRERYERDGTARAHDLLARVQARLAQAQDASRTRQPDQDTAMARKMNVRMRTSSIPKQWK